MPPEKKSDVGELTAHFELTSRLTTATTSSIASDSGPPSTPELMTTLSSSRYKQSILDSNKARVLCRCTVPLPALRNGMCAGAIMILVLDTFACRGQRLLHSSTVGQILSTSCRLATSDSVCLSAGSTRSAASSRCWPMTSAARTSG